MLTDEVLNQAGRKFMFCMNSTDVADFLKRMQARIDKGEIKVPLPKLIEEIRVYDGVDEWFEDNIDVILAGVPEPYKDVVAGAINIMNLRNRFVRANLAILELHNGFLVEYPLLADLRQGNTGYQQGHF